MTKQTIDDKVRELMSTKQMDLPPKALEYVKLLSSKIGYCGETCVSAFFAYCQIELKMECDDGYKVDEETIQMYKEIL